MSIEVQPETHDSDVEREKCWCGACGGYHTGNCPPEQEDDEDLRVESAERLRNAAGHLTEAAGLTDADFPIFEGMESSPDAEAVLLMEDLAAKILCEDSEPDPEFWSVPKGYQR